MLQEFKDFALKGNVVDLAVGVIIGAAFGKIVESLVGDIIMPIVGIFGSADFSNLYLVLKGTVAQGASLADAKKTAVVLGWGQFLTLVVNFAIVAAALFFVIKAMNKMKRKEEAKPEPVKTVPEDVKLLGEIRDLLATKR